VTGRPTVWVTIQSKYMFEKSIVGHILLNFTFSVDFIYKYMRKYINLGTGGNFF